jgi:sialic acid synthase SpsE
MKSLRIGSVLISNNRKPITIAEAAVEHLGSLNVAKRMVESAKASGADIIKFQMHLQDEEMLKNKIKFWGGSLDSILDKYNLTIEDHKQLIKYCKKIKIQYLCTPFSPKAVRVLDKLGAQGFKTGSGEMTNLEILNEIAKTRKPLILSTGMSNEDEIYEICNYLNSLNVNFAIMNCTSIYPCPYNKINLGYISKLKEKTKKIIGHSDHTPDIYSSFGAVANGAKIIEKHFTLNRNLKGPDYQVSLEPHEFKEMVNGIYKIYLASGNKKKLYKDEKIVQSWARHSVVATSVIKKDQMLKKKYLTVKRPGIGIPAKYINELTKYKAKKNIKSNSIIFWSNLIKKK